MSLQFRNTDVQFSPSVGGPKVQRGFVTFGSRVISADANLKGFEIGFTQGDHELYREKVIIKNVVPEGQVVTFDVELALRDKSGDWDDEYDGHVTVLVTAEVHDGGDN